MKLSQGSCGKCTTHGGGRRCDKLGCDKLSRKGGRCIAHGGGVRCTELGCNNSSQGRNGKCNTHGGRKRYTEAGIEESEIIGNDGRCIVVRSAEF